jgi:hypothetical protein
VLHKLALRAERVAVQRVGMEQVVFVVDCQRPEAFDRWQLPLREGDRVRILAVELLALAIEITVDVPFSVSPRQSLPFSHPSPLFAVSSQIIEKSE